MSDQHYDTIIECRADWISASCRRGRRARSLRDFGEGLLTAERNVGNESVPWRVHGYQGSVCGSVRTATGDNGALIQLSGAVSDAYRTALAGMADNWSRFDVALTTRASPAANPYAERWYRRISEPSRAGERRTRCSLVQNSWGGETLYLGHRTSDTFGRLYDKHAESEGRYPPGSWRWEIEFKSGRAQQWQQLHVEREITAEWLVSIVTGRFATWGVEVPIPQGRLGKLAALARPATDTERKLAWLYQQVRPTVQWLSDRCSQEALYNALGLPYDGEG